MNNSDQEDSHILNIHERYTTYSDNQIMDILKNHKDYQESAVNAAVKIAIERQLINSEQDLMSPEFQKHKNYNSTFFPEISNAYHHQRLVASIFRFLYVLTSLPVIYGFLKYAEGRFDQTYLGVGIGIIWLFLCILLKKTQKIVILIPLFVLLAMLSVLAAFRIFSADTIQILDIVMLVVGILLPGYMLIFLKKLIQNKPENI